MLCCNHCGAGGDESAAYVRRLLEHDEERAWLTSTLWRGLEAVVPAAADGVVDGFGY